MLSATQLVVESSDDTAGCPGSRGSGFQNSPVVEGTMTRQAWPGSPTQG